MRFYTNVQMVGDHFLVRGYENGRHFATREKFYPTLFVPSNKKTKYKTLEDKLNYLSIKKEDVYMLLSRSKKDWDKGERKYSFIAFPSDILQYSSMNWVDTFTTRGNNIGKLNGHKASNEVLDANISFSCSHQLWTKIKDFKDNKNIFIKEISV